MQLHNTRIDTVMQGMKKRLKDHGNHVHGLKRKIDGLEKRVSERDTQMDKLTRINADLSVHLANTLEENASLKARVDQINGLEKVVLVLKATMQKQGARNQEREDVENKKRRVG